MSISSPRNFEITKITIFGTVLRNECIKLEPKRIRTRASHSLCKRDEEKEDIDEVVICENSDF
uniref:Uncharacterized protein n=1 Tax=Romanomermis culicivorax TaxID=13658 RepID=A0A915J605_ROMCU